MIGRKVAVAAVAAASVTAIGLLTPAVANAGSGQFVRSQSGEILCDILYQGVYCQYPPGYLNAPTDPDTGQPFNLALVETSGELKWKTGEIVAWPDPEIQLADGGAYHMYGWVIQASAQGLRFTSDFTGRGMFVSIEDVQTF